MRIAMYEDGEPYKHDMLDIAIGVIAAVFMASCLGYLLGGWR